MSPEVERVTRAVHAQRERELEARVGVVERGRRTPRAAARAGSAPSAGGHRARGRSRRRGPGGPATRAASPSAAPRAPGAARPAAPGALRRARARAARRRAAASSAACSSATTSPSPGSAPAGAQLERPPRALGAARARAERRPSARARRARGRRPARAARAGAGPSGSATNASTGAARAGRRRRRGLSSGAATAPGPRRLASALGVDALDDERGDPRRRRPAGAHGGGAHASGGGRRVGGEQEHELRAAALALAGERPTARPRSPRSTRRRSRRCRRRSPRRGGRGRRLEAGAHAGLDEAPPGDLRADAVGGQQRVERAPLAQLAAAELEVDAPVALADAAGLLDRVHEAAQRALDAVAQRHAERALQRARVVGHLARRSRGSSRRPGRAEPGAEPLQPRAGFHPLLHKPTDYGPQSPREIRQERGRHQSVASNA